MFRPVLAVLGVLLTAPGAAAHPQDGPHADIRIAVTDEAVRFNLGLNLAFMDEIAPPVREALDAVAPSEEGPLRDAMERFVTERLGVAIDDEPREIRFVSFEFQRPDPALLPLFPRFRHRALLRAHVVAEVPIDAPPRSVSITWPVFPPDALAEQVEVNDKPPPMVIEARFEAEGKLEILRFSITEPTATWRSGGTSAEDLFAAVPEPDIARPVWRLPVVTIALAGVWLIALLAAFGRAREVKRVLVIGLPLVLVGGYFGRNLARLVVPDPLAPAHARVGHDNALEIFRALHRNMYHAFDFTGEEDIYDALALSVDGPLLDELYNELYQSLVMRDEGGALARVTDLVPLRTSLEWDGERYGTVGFGVVHTWRVEGTIYHWGHSHVRTNEYEAGYTVLARPDGWRITAHEIRAQRRVEEPPPDDPYRGEL